MSIDASLWKCCRYNLWVPSDSQDWTFFWSPQWPAATAAATDTTPSAGIPDHSIVSWGQCQALEIGPSSHLPIMPEALEALVLLTLLNQTHVGSDSSYHWLQWIFPKIASHMVGSGFCSKSQRGEVMQSGQQRVSSPYSKYWPTRAMRWEGIGR